MRVTRLLVPLLLLCVFGVTGGLLYYERQKEETQAIANTKQFDAQSWKDARIIANIQSESEKQEQSWYFEVLQVDSPTSRKILDREQLERQFIQEWFATKKQEQISAGADDWVIQQIDEAMHKTELKAVQDANDVITNLANGDNVKP